MAILAVLKDASSASLLEEDFVLGMERSNNIVVRKGVPINQGQEEFVLGMERSSELATMKDAPIMPEEEEFVSVLKDAPSTMPMMPGT